MTPAADPARVPRTAEELAPLLIAELDRRGYPARTAGADARDRVIARDVLPLARALDSVPLDGRELGYLAWLATGGTNVTAVLTAVLQRARAAGRRQRRG